MPWRFAGYAEDEDLTRLISLPNLEVLEGRTTWKGVVRCPVDAATVYPDTKIRFDVVRWDSPVLGQLWKAITPVRGTSDRNL